MADSLKLAETRPLATGSMTLLLAGALSMLLLIAGWRSSNTIGFTLPDILCSTSAQDAARPRTVVTTLRTEPLAGAPGKWVTTQLVRLPPRALSAPHFHGGDVTAYVLEGNVRSEHAGLPVADYAMGQVFFEPMGTTHQFFENPSYDQAAAVLAVTIHDEGAVLTTFLK
ncbi:MAG: hypothetical protein BGP04_03445 [Rhizobiales bacterium 62-17]|nr:MAG: hypothetical protein BGP04_03445 [Rhizobiales bacterium 62-17]